MAGRRGIFSDFDGTLSPIVPVPGDARAVAGAREALALRVSAGDFVCLVSGRAASFLQDVVGLEGVVYRGLHGMERAVGSGSAEPVPKAREASAAVASAATALTRAVAAHPGTEMEDQGYARTRHYRRPPAPAAAAGPAPPHPPPPPGAGPPAGPPAAPPPPRAAPPLPGTEMEDKGYALTLHYRRTPDPAAAAGPAHEIALAAAREAGCVVRAGRLCWEILPPADMDKGLAVEEECRAAALGSALFAGDDVGDLAAFDALDRLADGGVATTKIGVRSPEAPQALLERADVLLDGPAAVVEYLRAL